MYVRACVPKVFGLRLYDDVICFAADFKESIPSTPPTDLYGTLTHDIYQSAMKHYLLAPEKNRVPYFRRLCNSMATLRANIFGEEQGIDNREKALETSKGPLHHPKIS